MLQTALHTFISKQLGCCKSTCMPGRLSIHPQLAGQPHLPPFCMLQHRCQHVLLSSLAVQQLQYPLASAQGMSRELDNTADAMLPSKPGMSSASSGCGIATYRQGGLTARLCLILAVSLTGGGVSSTMDGLPYARMRPISWRRFAAYSSTGMCWKPLSKRISALTDEAKASEGQPSRHCAEPMSLQALTPAGRGLQRRWRLQRPLCNLGRERPVRSLHRYASARLTKPEGH